MPRIELLDATTAPLTAAPFFSDGDPGPLVAALAHVPELLGPTFGFVGAALGPGAASIRHKEFAILRTSALQGCRYCIHAHTAVALDVGLSADEIRALRGEAEIEAVFANPGERALINWIDSLAGATGPVPAVIWEAASAAFAPHILLELTMTVGATMVLNRYATAFELPSSPATLERLAGEGFA